MKNRKKLLKNAKPIAVLVLAIILSALITLTVLAAYCNLQTLGTSCNINGAYFVQFDPTQSSGSGVFPTFLKIQAKGTEKGYNTDGALEFDAKQGSHAILLSQVPQVTINSAVYREFGLDINESVGELVSLDAVQVFRSESDVCSGYNSGVPSITCPTPDTTTLVYDFDGDEDNWAGLNYNLQPGSGVADYIMLILDSSFEDDGSCDFKSDTCSTYVYLYSEFGAAGGEYISDNGFEEWGLADPAQFQPAIHIEKSTNGFNADGPPGPTVQWGDPVTWTYTVTIPITGTVPISNVVVTDDILATIPITPTYQSGDTDLDDQLDLDEEWIYQATGACTVAGQYANIGTVNGQYGIDPVILVSDEDPSHHWCLSPTAVTFDYLTATPQISNNILLEWATVNEINNAGFNLYRSQDPDVLGEHLGFIQPKNPGGFEGAVYNFLDEELNPGTTWYYTLKSVDVDKVVDTLGTVRATIFYKAFLALIY